MNVAVPALKNDSEIVWEEIAREAVEATDGTAAQAIPWMVAKLKSDRALLEASLDQALTAFCTQVVTAVYRHRRERQNPAGAEIIRMDGGDFNRALIANAERWMARPVWGGKPIGSCTAEEIYESADRYDRQAKAMTREASWQSAVATALEKNRASTSDTVRDCLTESTMEKLWEEASAN